MATVLVEWMPTMELCRCLMSTKNSYSFGNYQAACRTVVIGAAIATGEDKRRKEEGGGVQGSTRMHLVASAADVGIVTVTEALACWKTLGGVGDARCGMICFAIVGKFFGQFNSPKLELFRPRCMPTAPPNLLF